jgi:hypothetical protein
MATDSDLTSFTVSLPRAQKEYLQRQAVATGCSTPSEYVRRLIHADQKARSKEDLEAKLLEAEMHPGRDHAAWHAMLATSGLLDKATLAAVVPKIFYTNGSYEYWGRSAGLIHSSLDGKQDALMSPGSRASSMVTRPPPRRPGHERRGVHPTPGRDRPRSRRSPDARLGRPRVCLAVVPTPCNLGETSRPKPSGFGGSVGGRGVTLRMSVSSVFDTDHA